jgi:hypothetical protein
MNEHHNKFCELSRLITTDLISMHRHRSRVAVAIGLLLLCPVVASAFDDGGPPPQKNRPAADKNENILIVRVTAEGKPVAGAQVVALYVEKLPIAVTDRDGLTRVSLPPGGKINGLVALHPTLGMDGHWFGFPTEPSTVGGPFQLALAPPRPHTLRVVDAEGKPVPNVRCVIENVSWAKNPSLNTGGFEAAHFETDRHGEARLAWMPRHVRAVMARIVDERWKTDDSSTVNGRSTVGVRRLEPVSGRLRMPEGVSAEGLTISADGSHESGWRHETKARVGRDGSFTIYLAAGDAYAVQLTDSKWASDAWTGVVPRDTAPPAIDLVGYPATPLSIRVTRGPRHEPVANAWIYLSSLHKVLWKDGRGRSMVMQPGIRTGLYTDGSGTARLFVGKGQHSVFMALEKWREERTVGVTSSQPVGVAFDRPWTDKRTITGQLLVDHKPHAAAPGTIVRAWCTTRRQIAAEGTVLPSGRFRVEIDAAEVSLFTLDAKSRLTAFRQIGQADAAADLELVPVGSYSGTVVDSNGKPAADYAVQLVLDVAGLQMRHIVLQSARCDERGRFQLDLVPAKVSLLILAGTPASARGTAFSERSREFAVDSHLEFLLDPAEKRENVRLVAIPRNPDGSPRVKPPRESVEAHLKRRIRDVRLAGMRLLVILRGDASKEVAEFTEMVRNSDEPPELLRYIPLYFASDEIETASGFLSGLGWERPKAGEVVLVAVDGTGATLGSHKITVAGNAAAEALAAQFVRRYALPSLDAQQLLETAQREARETGRRLVFVEGGPRCDPCRELARWMDDQHSLLSKDYVILKLLGSETHSGDVIGKFRSNRNGGIPWFAIAEPDGTVLATSDSPLGNTGFPSGFEEKKYFKKILDRTARHLTSAERERLIESLPKE